MLGKLDESEIDELLSRNIIGRLGYSNGEKIFVIPVNYVFDGKDIIIHSKEGEKIRIMRKAPQVCFEVDESEDPTNWRSVIAWGTFEEIKDEEDKYDAERILVERFRRVQVSETAGPPHLDKKRAHAFVPGDIKSVIWRIAIKEKTGRFEKN